MTMNASQLSVNEYLPYFQGYIKQAGTIALIDGLESNLNFMLNFYDSIPREKLEFRYAEGKWTIKEVLNHLIDAERIFCYRALRFARKDTTALSGFEENDYAINSKANEKTIANLLDEYKTLRLSTISLFKSFDSEMLLNKGTANGGEVSVRALGFLIIGHEKHHYNIIKERYL